jgi:hypothetical protein
VHQAEIEGVRRGRGNCRKMMQMNSELERNTPKEKKEKHTGEAK